jgi:CheY-like chemotaxis protein
MMATIRKILVVDDEPDVRSMLRSILENAGYEVSEAANGVEGVGEYARTQPECVVADILMPKKGGLQLIREIRDLNPETKILAISGGGSNGKLNFLATAKTISGVRALRKPFRMNELLQTLREMCVSPSGDTTVLDRSSHH